MRFLKNAALAALLLLSVLSSAQAADVCVNTEALIANIQADPKSADANAKLLSAELSAQIGKLTDFPFMDSLGQIDTILIPGSGTVVMFPLNKDGCAFGKDGNPAAKFEDAIAAAAPIQQFLMLLQQVPASSI